MNRPDVPPPVDEVVYFRGSPSGTAPILSTIKATLIFFTVIFVLSFEVFAKLRDVLGAYSLLIVVAWLAHVAWVWWGWKTIQYTLTNRKITFERGHFAKTIKSIELWRVREMIFQRGVLESFVGVGRIHLVSNDLTGPFTQVGPIVNANRVYQSLNEAREVAIKERGVMAVES